MSRLRLELILWAWSHRTDRLITGINSLYIFFGCLRKRVIHRFRKLFWVCLESSHLATPTTPGGDCHWDYFSRPVLRIIVDISLRNWIMTNHHFLPSSILPYFGTNRRQSYVILRYSLSATTEQLWSVINEQSSWCQFKCMSSLRHLFCPALCPGRVQMAIILGFLSCRLKRQLQFLDRQ